MNKNKTESAEIELLRHGSNQGNTFSTTNPSIAKEMGGQIC